MINARATLALTLIAATLALACSDAASPGGDDDLTADTAPDTGDDDLTTDAAPDAVADAEPDAEPDSAELSDEPDAGPPALTFPEGFVFGVATAAHQIEGGNTNNNWFQFETLPLYAGQTLEASGDAINSYELWQTDNQLVEDLHLDSYRFSIEWSRIMPRYMEFDEDAIAHYRAIIDDLRGRGIEPFVTLHHFTDPIWLNDLSDPDCTGGPSETNLCGWDNPDAVTAFTAFATRAAEEYGDAVDRWTTFNEPNTVTNVGYLTAIHAPGEPGGGVVVPTDARYLERVVPVSRAFIEAHVGAYDAIHAADTVDADGDGEAAIVGWTLATQHLMPADPENPRHVAAAERYGRFLNSFFADAVATGVWDPDVDGVADEQHDEWIGKQDFIGVQYYSRIFVVNNSGSILSFAPCQGLIRDLLPACPELDPLNLSAFNEIYPEGLYEVVRAYASRYPGVPLPITENGAAADDEERKAQIMVRHLEQVARLVADGYPVAAYYYWTLADNFEWAEGYEARFGLYSVDRETFARSATVASELFGDIVESHVIDAQTRARYATGPLRADEPAE